MLALVLSGGGNRGAMQVGALQVLLEAGIVPDMIVGSSVGAINGAYMAYDPTLRGTHALAHLWTTVTRQDLYPGNYLTALWSILRGKESLFANSRWYDFLQHHIPCDTFGELRGARCFVTATELATGRPALFGADPTQPIIDALMASCALPPLHPPYPIQGQLYIDGGATTNLPLRYAVDQGATRVYALNIVSGPLHRKERNFIDVSARAVESLVQHQATLDVEHCHARNALVRRIDLVFNGDLEPWDFSQTERLMELGREATRLALEEEGPLQVPTWSERLAMQTEQFVASISDATANLGQWVWPKAAAKRPAVAPVRPLD